MALRDRRARRYGDESRAHVAEMLPRVYRRVLDAVGRLERARRPAGGGPLPGGGHPRLLGSWNATEPPSARGRREPEPRPPPWTASAASSRAPPDARLPLQHGLRRYRLPDARPAGLTGRLAAPGGTLRLMSDTAPGTDRPASRHARRGARGRPGRPRGSGRARRDDRGRVDATSPPSPRRARSRLRAAAGADPAAPLAADRAAAVAGRLRRDGPDRRPAPGHRLALDLPGRRRARARRARRCRARPGDRLRPAVRSAGRPHPPAR